MFSSNYNVFLIACIVKWWTGGSCDERGHWGGTADAVEKVVDAVLERRSSEATWYKGGGWKRQIR